MTETHQKIPLAHAKAIADDLLNQAINFCDIGNIAGSVRRKVEEVHDIELCMIPKITTIENKNLFGEIEHTAKIIHPEFERIIKGWGRIIKGQPSGRYMQLEIERRFLNMDWLVTIDLFMPQPHDYVRQYIIRTGSAEYVKRLANQWVKKGWRGTTDGLRRQSECYQIGENKWVIQKQYASKPTLPPRWEKEVDFFSWLNVLYLMPEYRNL